MIKEIKSSEIKKFIDSNPDTVLLDVRTENEWRTVGKPDTKDLGIKSFFITISQGPGFLERVKKRDKGLQETEVMQNLLNKLVYDKYTGNYGFQN